MKNDHERELVSILLESLDVARKSIDILMQGLGDDDPPSDLVDAAVFVDAAIRYAGLAWKEVQ